MNWDKATIGLLIRSIYDGRVDPANLPYKLYKAIADYLTKGVFKGFGKDISDTVSDTVDHELLYNLRENVHIFSGAKTFNYVLETTNLIVEGDEILPLREFKKRALEIYDKYNVNWLDAEYETCIGQAQNATKWKDIETSPFDLVKYLAVIDENTSPVCVQYNGIVKDRKDPFWNEAAPLNHYRCRCLLQSVPDGIVSKKTISDFEIQPSPTFRNNAGQTGEVFTKEHPYFTDIPTKYRKLAKQNWGLPLPK